MTPIEVILGDFMKDVVWGNIHCNLFIHISLGAKFHKVSIVT